MRILLAIDGSPSSIKARDLIAGLPWPPDTVIDLLAAYQAPVDWTTGMASRAAVAGDAAEAVLKKLGEQLRELGEPLSARGWVVEPRVIRERPATAIVAAATEFDADLVVVATGRSTRCCWGRWRPRSSTWRHVRSSSRATITCRTC
jgi:nucleotide-binding universal stress UspA family protein